MNLRKMVLHTLAAAAVIAGTTGCTTGLYPGGPTPAGIIYTEVTGPAQHLAVATHPDAEYYRRGEASAVAFLGLFAFGNNGVHAAMQNGSITKVHHVDHTVQHFLYALYVNHKTIVYGE